MSLDPPDDPTVIRPRTAAAAAPPGSHDDSLALPIGTRLGEFELTSRIGEGGFGIVYRAWDHSLEREVALKEYLPSSIATRIGATRISCRSDRHRETFEAGLKSFINEAKLLARFDHPSLVKVFRFWEANGTAYMVMPFYEGTTMRDTVRAMSQPPGEAWIMELLAALTEALSVIHREQCYHRDIAPDNVMLLKEGGRPLLLDFGAARRVIGDMTQALTVILKPGYAPVEQYAEVPGMKQGPWTDVYALAAVVYWTITGKTPPPSVGRMLSDSWVPLSQAAEGRYSPGFLAAIDRALAVRPEARTPDIATLRAEIGLAGGSPVTVSLPSPDPDTTVIRTRPAPTVATRAAPAEPPPPSSPTIVTTRAPAPPAAAPRAPVADAAGPARSGLGAAVWGGGAAALLLLAAGAWWLTRPAPTPSAPAPPVAEAPAPAPIPPAPAPPPPPPAPVAARSPAEAVAQWLAGRDPAWQVELKPPAAPLVAGKEAPRLALSSSQPGQVYLIGHREGSGQLVLWHPASGGAARVESRLELSPAIWAARPPEPGRWSLVALVSASPQDLAAAGWTARNGVLVREFEGPAPASGDCLAAVTPCNGRFGAQAIDVEVRPAPAPAPAPAAKPPAPAPAPAVARPPAPAGNAAECARLIQQMSLGDTSAALTDRFKALGCR
ncbi:serine/threonine protein kinase [Piscinibacter defluvii]|uniref:serine/threonine protein kinase n=1 Tax=Piscinibacter defluvii TaxID=1796922 RepID=UPI001F0C006C|nr:serine/threonine-protein kinase [Piscinibacter defluvii]